MHKLVSHEYFMDRLSIIEIPIITKYLEYSDAIAWSQTRQIMLCQLKPYLKNKNISASEFFPLPIDKDYEREKITEVDPRALEWFRNLKKKKEGN